MISIPMLVVLFCLINFFIVICRRMQSLELMTIMSSDLKRDPDEVFDHINTNGGGMVLFNEFCHFHLQKNAEFRADDKIVFGFETRSR